jgi:hypothetical protein
MKIFKKHQFHDPPPDTAAKERPFSLSLIYTKALEYCQQENDK